MGKWLKKVDETPLVQNARVIDSLSGNSTVNAPSIHAVNYWLNNPLGNLINEGYSESHPVAQVLKTLETAHDNISEDLTGMVVNTYGNTYNPTYNLVRYGRVFEFRAYVENIPVGTRIQDILVLPSNYIRSNAGRIGVNLMATVADVSKRQAFINTNGNIDMLYQSDTVQNTAFYMSATWIY